MVKYSIEQQVALLSEFDDSGLTVASFCRSKGINPKTFGNWQYKRRRATSQPSPQPSIIPISIKQLTPANINIIFPNGVRIESECGLDDVLARLIKTF